MSTTRTTKIRLLNETTETLYFLNPTSTEGPVATASVTSFVPGQEMWVTATNTATFYAGNEGTFTIANASGSLSYTFAYTHPQGSGTSNITQQSGTPGALAGFNKDEFTGDPIFAEVRLYQGVAVPGVDGAYAVPLSYNSAGNNQNFLNSLFGPNMRSPTLVTAAASQTTTPYTPADYTAGQLDAVVDALYAVWMGSISGNAADAAIITFLKGFLGPTDAPPMNIWIPAITYKGGSPVIYELTGYDGGPMMSTNSQGNGVDWNPDKVRTFLKLLVGGAHFVCISADDDFTNQSLTNPGRDLYAAFKDSGLSQRDDLGCSHYKSVLNDTGVYYLSYITTDFAPMDCGLLVSLLFGCTVNDSDAATGTYNTFMQLEGWPAHGLRGGTRHMADYDASTDSLWNISTFGATPYSEKRATTVFLAPGAAPGHGQWLPRLYQTTRMMPYVGAYATGNPPGSPQGWLNTDVVQIPSGTAALPSKYYT